MNMKEFFGLRLLMIFVGASLVGCFGLIIEWVALDSLMDNEIVSTKKDFWEYMLIIYAFLLIPPMFMIGVSLSANTKDNIVAGGLAVLGLLHWISLAISVGFLFGFGFYLFETLAST